MLLGMLQVMLGELRAPALQCLPHPWQGRGDSGELLALHLASQVPAWLAEVPLGSVSCDRCRQGRMCPCDSPGKECQGEAG